MALDSDCECRDGDYANRWIRNGALQAALRYLEHLGNQMFL